MNAGFEPKRFRQTAVRTREAIEFIRSVKLSSWTSGKKWHVWKAIPNAQNLLRVGAFVGPLGP